MQSLIFDIGETGHVDVHSVGGDLRLSGREEKQVELKVPSDANLDIDHQDDQLRITCPTDCLIFLPRNASVEIQSVGGDMRAMNVAGELSIRTVGGSLSLRGHGEVSVETIGGDFHARMGSGTLTVDRIGGDALIDRISGSVDLRSVGGDLKLRRVDGSVDLAVGGDASLALSTLGGEHIIARAGGDLACDLPSDASATVTLSAGGSLHAPETPQEDQSGDRLQFTLGEGGIPVELAAGGDLWFQADETSEQVMYAGLGDMIASQVESDLEAGIAKMEAKLEAISAGVGTYPSERIGEQVRRAVTRARRKAERARRSAAGQKRRRRAAFRFDVEVPGSEAPGISEDERISILKMLEKGTITVEEAEKLLQALEGGQ